MLPQHSTEERVTIAHSLLESIRHTLARMGLHDATDGRYDRWIYLVVVIVASVVVMFILRLATGYILQRISQYKRATFVRRLYNSHFISRLLWLIPPLGIHIMLPYAFTDATHTLLQRLCNIALVGVFVYAINTLITVVWDAFYEHSKLRDRPMRGVVQIIHGIIIALGCIIAISILINRSPTTLITGLGAFAAVLMLVFKDTILGFVAGIELSQYDMVRNGDWITIPGTIVDGVVCDVSLNTVKVRNFDNTTVTLPPYTLISQPLQNWRGMDESGGRRIMRSIIIDADTIHFCTADVIQSLKSQPLIADFIAANNIQLIDPTTPPQNADTTAAEGIETNIGLLRRYLLYYIQHHPRLQHDGFTTLVRTLQPDVNGIPLQLYCFTNTTQWEEYEIIQSQVIEYTTSILPLFGLSLFQNASSRDYIEQARIEAGGNNRPQ